jgi:hypothetical protein
MGTRLRRHIRCLLCVMLCFTTIMMLGCGGTEVGNPEVSGGSATGGGDTDCGDATTPGSDLLGYKLQPSDGVVFGGFGFSVSISGETVMVGMPLDDDNGSPSGSAYVFQRNGDDWVETAKLTASDGAEFDEFGGAVSISGDYAVVGAREKDDGSGAAYVFYHTGSDWIETAKLTPTDASAGDYFGTAVSISGDLVVVGAEHDDDRANNSGAAYIFQRFDADWVEAAKLTASDGVVGARFGISVAISGDTVIVGAEFDSPSNDEYESGSAYIFQRSNGDWTEVAKLRASNGNVFHRFGGAVSISGDTVIVGAVGDDSYGNNSGAAYVFQESEGDWVETAKLTASDGAAYGFFGGSVSISGDRVIVGAVEGNNGGYAVTQTDVCNFGSAYIFLRSGGEWVETAKLIAFDQEVDDYFGRSVSLSDDDAIIGAPGDRQDGIESGSAYIFNDLAAHESK